MKPIYVFVLSLSLMSAPVFAEDAAAPAAPSGEVQQLNEQIKEKREEIKKDRAEIKELRGKRKALREERRAKRKAARAAGAGK